jgi:hypothetical protein
VQEILFESNREAVVVVPVVVGVPTLTVHGVVVFILIATGKVMIMAESVDVSSLCTGVKEKR